MPEQIEMFPETLPPPTSEPPSVSFEDIAVGFVVAARRWEQFCQRVMTRADAAMAHG